MDRNGGRTLCHRMPQENMARRFLRLGDKSGALQSADNLFGSGARQAREHTYVMTGVLTVTPSDTGALVSVSSGMSSPCGASALR